CLRRVSVHLNYVAWACAVKLGWTTRAPRNENFVAVRARSKTRVGRRSARRRQVEVSTCLAPHAGQFRLAVWTGRMAGTAGTLSPGARGARWGVASRGIVAAF